MIKSVLLLIFLNQAPVDSIDFKSPAQIFEEASKLEENDEYEKAVQLYQSVSESDTAFLEAQTNLMFAYNALERYAEAINIGLKHKDTFSKSRKSFYLALGNAFSASGDPVKAREVYSKGLELYPHNSTFVYNVGLTHYREEQYSKAIPYLQQSLKFNPYYSQSHMLLGYISMLQGHRTKALLSYYMYLAINPGNNGVLVFLENLVSDNIKKEGSIKPVTDNTYFERYDEILRSKAALDDRFKQQVDFNANIVKQTELLFSLLKHQPNTTDFWMDYYVPIYEKLHNEQLGHAFTYFILTSTKDESVKTWLSKHEKEKSSWISQATSILNKNRSINNVEVKGVKDDYGCWYFNSNALSAIGNQIDDDTRTGPWIFFNEANQADALGEYNNKGEKIGTWHYYHANGRLRLVEEFSDDGEFLLSGEYYHENGELSIVVNYQENEVEGNLEYYFNCDQLKEAIPYELGIKKGKARYYYETGELHADYFHKEDLLEDKFTYYYKNGQTNVQYTYVEDHLSGPYISYYSDGQENEIGQYEADSISGEWIGYHPRGVMSYKGTLINGNRDGEWINYYDNGKQSEVLIYNNGELNGECQYFNEKGSLVRKETYDEGKFIGSVFYNLLGETIYESFNKEGNMAFKSYFVTGQLRQEGTVKNGKLEGAYKQYYSNGNLNYESTMVEGKLTGPYKEYYPTGQIGALCTYKAGELDGYYKSFYKNGNPKQEGWYVNGDLEQEWKTYHPDGTLNEEQYYISGKTHGNLKVYAAGNKIDNIYKYDRDKFVGLQQFDSTGNVYYEYDLGSGNGLKIQKTVKGDTIAIATVKCGEVVSDVRDLYPGGALNSKIEMKNSENNGKVLAYTIEGKPYMKGAFVDNERQGHWQWFHSNGNIEIDNNYNKDELDGERKVYYYNGKLESVALYDNGTKSGPIKYYDHYGNLQMIKLYDKELGFVAYIDSQSKDTIAFKEKGEFSLKSYFSNGKIAVEQEYLDGKLHGTATYYDLNGKRNSVIDYKYGDNHGKWIEYYPNGNVYVERHYIDDQENGNRKEYYENGKPRRTTPYVHDDKHGTEIIYYPSGKVKLKTTYWNDEIY
ncbi:MAG: hypothetical protein ABFS32_03995 [Bacteroidota bacterium]